TTCSVGSMNKDDVATFLATYLVDGGAQNGTVISNTVSVSSTASQAGPATPDPNGDNNSSTATAEVANAPCVLSCPSDIEVNADTGQAGAVVTYTDPSHSGNCGTAGTGEDGETAPIVNCSVASGSFFPVGVTTVVCAAQTGETCTFQVTVQNPGGLSIS